MASNSNNNWRRYLNFNEIARYADEHHREMTAGIYLVGATGIIIIVRSLRIFTKFTTVSKIPDSYFRKQVKLQGFVRSVEEGEKATLNVEHIPVVELGYHKGIKTCLPVRLAGLGKWHEPAASKYVANQVLNKRVSFQLIQEGPKEEYLLAGVYYQPYRFLPNRSLNADLVENGLAPYLFAGEKEITAEETDPKTGKTVLFQPQPVDRKLAERLMEAHKVAFRRQVGIWRVAQPGETASTLSFLVPSQPDRWSTIVSAAQSTASSASRAFRYVASAVVFLPAQIKDKIMQRRSISS